MSINLTDEIEVKTKKGKLGSAKQIFLEGDIQTVENEIQNINSRHNTLNIKHESLSKIVQGITVTGGASTSTNVTYNNNASRLNAENAQDAIDEVSNMVTYDVSARNGGVVFESLQSLLSSDNLSTLIPTAVRCGGMSIRFVQSSDNKYVQYFLTKNIWSASETDWEKMNLEEEVNQLEKRCIKKTFPSLKNVIYDLGFTLNPNTTYYVYLKGGDDSIALYYNGTSQSQYSFLKKDNITIITTGSEPNEAQIYSNNIISSSVEIIFSLETGFQDIISRDISSIEEDISSIEGDISSIEGDISSIVNGKYINLYGELVDYSSAKYGIIQLNKGDLIKIVAVGNYTVSLLSKTNAEGTIFSSLFAGKGDRTQIQTSKILYIIEETGYYAFCSANSSIFEIYKLTNNCFIQLNKSQKELQEEIISSLIPEQEYSISMFEKVACCGDSYVIGQIYNSGGVVGDRPNLSWGKNIGRLEGIEINIYASSGADTNTWQTRSTCLPAALAASPSGLYIFCMGINDTAYVTKGSMEDITNYEDYHDYPNTFYGNYGKIIEQIKAHAPNSKIIIMTPCHPDYIYNWLTPITEITEYYNIAMINTQNSNFINSSEFTSRLMGGHPTAALHGALAIEIIKLVSNCINNNYNYFKDYIGL